MPADWYFPTQVDGTVDAQGVIWLQHASGAAGSSLASLAVELARQTNSIVVAPSLPTSMNWSLADAAATRAVAALFEGDRSALVASAVAAGYAGEASELTGKFVLAGHSAGGGFMTAVAADYAAQNVVSSDLAGVVMYDGVSGGAFDDSGSFATQVAALDSRSIPVYQLAAPAQLWNAYGATTNALLAVDPGRFRGVVLTNGSHVGNEEGVGADKDAHGVGQFANRLTAHHRPLRPQTTHHGQQRRRRHRDPASDHAVATRQCGSRPLPDRRLDQRHVFRRHAECTSLRLLRCGEFPDCAG